MDATIELNAAALMEAAETEAGLHDWGDRGFVEPLDNFLDSALTEAGLNGVGRLTLQMEVIRMLVNRLRIQHAITRHPEVPEEDVSGPIVILGVPRTGTTKLQRAFGADPGVQSMLLWKVLFPAPLPGDDGKGDSRIAAAKVFQDSMNELGTEFLVAHDLDANEPEEESVLMQMTFDKGSSLDWFYGVPSYAAWVRDRPADPAYAQLRTAMQYLQWQDGGREGRPWVLKAPAHLGNVAALCRALPRATLVHCHRNLDEAVPSIASFSALIRRARGSETVVHEEVGSFYATDLADHWRRNLEQRGELGPDVVVLDVRYEDIRDDVVGVIREIRAARGEELTDEAAAAIRAWERAHPKDRHGKHRYSLAQYGLSQDVIRERFAAYYERFPDGVVG